MESATYSCPASPFGRFVGSYSSSLSKSEGGGSPIQEAMVVAASTSSKPPSSSVNQADRPPALPVRLARARSFFNGMRGFAGMGSGHHLKPEDIYTVAERYIMELKMRREAF